MDKAKQHWKILQELGNGLANRVRSFLVIGEKGDGVIVVTRDGQGFWMGKIKFGSSNANIVPKPTRIEVAGLVHMAQGQRHILLLSKWNEIYSIGQNDEGQLGLGTKNEETHFTPQLIPSTHKFISVGCGHEHSLALTEDGKVLAWGRNYCDQVGVLSSVDSLLSPHQFPELDSHRIVSVECGGRHSLALTDQGEVYGWGSNSYGQLGNDSNSSTNIPTRIPTPSSVQSIAAGYSHTLLLTQEGEVYACGWNSFGQLALPTTTKSSASLTKIDNLPTISKIASHSDAFMSIAMSSDQRCFVWGKLNDGTSISTPRELPSDYSTIESQLSFYSPNRSITHSFTIPAKECLLGVERKNPKCGLSARMFDNPESSDVQFVVEQRTIHAHRSILINSSDYFARMFSESPNLVSVDPENPIIQVSISDHSYSTFHAFLRFLYADCFEVQFDLLPELYDLASEYLESDLKQLCLSRMRQTLSTSNCCLYYQLTLRRPELAAFQQKLAKFMSTNYLDVYSTPAYQSMDDEICKKLTLSMHGISPDSP